MASIRVDQSHCNQYLAQVLREQDWRILFTDPGRATRGGTGLQGVCLRIFEETGSPIPDIVAVLNSSLLLVEIDSSYSKARSSVERYMLRREALIADFNDRLSPFPLLSQLLIGFCRTGITRNPEAFFTANRLQAPEVDMWVVFEQPRIPRFLWTN